MGASTDRAELVRGKAEGWALKAEGLSTLSRAGASRSSILARRMMGCAAMIQPLVWGEEEANHCSRSASSFSKSLLVVSFSFIRSKGTDFMSHSSSRTEVWMSQSKLLGSSRYSSHLFSIEPRYSTHLPIRSDLLTADRMSSRVSGSALALSLTKSITWPVSRECLRMHEMVWRSVRWIQCWMGGGMEVRLRNEFSTHSQKLLASWSPLSSMKLCRNRASVSDQARGSRYSPPLSRLDSSQAENTLSPGGSGRPSIIDRKRGVE